MKRQQTLVIDRPELQSPFQRVMFTSLTATFWFIWIYIWLPLFNLLAWVLGIKIFYDEMIIRDGLHSLLLLSGVYALVILALGGSLIAWGVYNWIRFAGIERRQHIPIVTITDTAHHFRVSVNALIQWQDARRMIVYVDDSGLVTHVDMTASTIPPNYVPVELIYRP